MSDPFSPDFFDPGATSALQARQVDVGNCYRPGTRTAIVTEGNGRRSFCEAGRGTPIVAGLIRA